MWSDWLAVCDCGFSLSALWCPLSEPLFYLGFFCLGCGVSTHGRRSWPRTWGSASWSLCAPCAAATPSPALAAPALFPGGPAGNEPACNVRDLGSIPGLRRSPGEEKGYSLQYSAKTLYFQFYVIPVKPQWRNRKRMQNNANSTTDENSQHFTNITCAKTIIFKSSNI